MLKVLNSSSDTDNDMQADTGSWLAGYWTGWLMLFAYDIV